MSINCIYENGIHLSFLELSIICARFIRKTQETDRLINKIDLYGNSM